MPKKDIWWVLLSVMFIVGMCISPGVFAEESDVSEIGIDGPTELLLFMEQPSVVTASKKEESISKAPAVITVVTANDIKAYGSVTLYDVLQRLPGVQPVGSHLFPNNVMVTRGDLVTHYDNHVLVLINGRPFRDAVAGGLNLTLYGIFPVDLIERIEVVRGPGSVLYGTNAIDGVINIITRQPQKDIEVDLYAGGGSLNSVLGGCTAGYQQDDFYVLANTNYLKNDGWDFQASTVLPGTPNVHDSMKYYKNDLSGSLFMKYKNFTLNSYHAVLEDGNLGINPAYQFSGGEGQTWLDTVRTFADIGYSQTLLDTYVISANLTYNRFVFTSHTKQIPSGEGTASVLGEISFGGSIIENLNFIVGGLLANDKRIESENARLDAFDKHSASGYFQMDYSPLEALKFIAGLQYNKPSNIDGMSVPRVGLIYQIFKQLGTKVSYAESFRAPWAMETVVNFPGVIVGNPDLKPETSRTADIQIFYNGQKMHHALTMFSTRYQNLIGRVLHDTIPNTSTYDNVGSMEISGVELESKVSLTDALLVEGSGSYQKEKDDKVLTPDYMVKIGLSYHTPFGLNVGVFNSHFGKPKNNGGLALNPDAQAMNLLSLNVTYQPPVLKAMTVKVFIQNALNQTYHYPEFDKNWVNTLPLESGRTIYGSVSYDF